MTETCCKTAQLKDLKIAINSSNSNEIFKLCEHILNNKSNEQILLCEHKLIELKIENTPNIVELKNSIKTMQTAENSPNLLSSCLELINLRNSEAKKHGYETFGDLFAFNNNQLAEILKTSNDELVDYLEQLSEYISSYLKEDNLSFEELIEENEISWTQLPALLHSISQISEPISLSTVYNEIITAIKKPSLLRKIKTTFTNELGVAHFDTATNTLNLSLVDSLFTLKESLNEILRAIFATENHPMYGEYIHPILPATLLQVACEYSMLNIYLEDEEDESMLNVISDLERIRHITDFLFEYNLYKTPNKHAELFNKYYNNKPFTKLDSTFWCKSEIKIHSPFKHSIRGAGALLANAVLQDNIDSIESFTDAYKWLENSFTINKITL